MNGNINIEIKDKQGNIKYKSSEHNVVFPTYMNVVRSKLNSTMYSLNNEEIPSMPVDLFSAVALYSDSVDTSILGDLDYHTPELVGVSMSSFSAEYPSTFVNAETIERTSKSVSRKWSWSNNSSQNIELKSITLKSNSFYNMPNISGWENTYYTFSNNTFLSGGWHISNDGYFVHYGSQSYSTSVSIYSASSSMLYTDTNYPNEDKLIFQKLEPNEISKNILLLPFNDGRVATLAIYSSSDNEYYFLSANYSGSSSISGSLTLVVSSVSDLLDNAEASQYSEYTFKKSSLSGNSTIQIDLSNLNGINFLDKVNSITDILLHRRIIMVPNKYSNVLLLKYYDSSTDTIKMSIIEISKTIDDNENISYTAEEKDLLRIESNNPNIFQMAIVLGNVVIFNTTSNPAHARNDYAFSVEFKKPSANSPLTLKQHSKEFINISYSPANSSYPVVLYSRIVTDPDVTSALSFNAQTAYAPIDIISGYDATSNTAFPMVHTKYSTWLNQTGHNFENTITVEPDDILSIVYEISVR